MLADLKKQLDTSDEATEGRHDKEHLCEKAVVSWYKTSRLTCSLARLPLWVCSSSASPRLHRVSRGSCPHGKLYMILTPRDVGTTSSSSGMSPLLKLVGDRANWKSTDRTRKQKKGESWQVTCFMWEAKINSINVLCHYPSCFWGALL